MGIFMWIDLDILELALPIFGMALVQPCDKSGVSKGEGNLWKCRPMPPVLLNQTADGHSNLRVVCVLVCFAIICLFSETLHEVLHRRQSKSVYIWILMERWIPAPRWYLACFSCVSCTLPFKRHPVCFPEQRNECCGFLRCWRVWP